MNEKRKRGPLVVKFNSPILARTTVSGPVQTTGQVIPTFEGGTGYKRDAKGELFTLAITNLVGEDTFYESAAVRDERFRKLIHEVVAEDPGWVARFVPYLRRDLFLRSAPLVMAMEYALAGGPAPRKVIDSALQRADEPAEAIGYWMHRTGRRTLPGGVQRGIGDAVSRLFNEYAALKYDGVDSKTIRMGDVIELTHPKPVAPWQKTLFEYLLDRRHHSDAIRAEIGALSMVQERRRMRDIAVEDRRAALLADPDMLRRSGQTWEDVSGWLNDGKGMTAEVWEALLGPDAKGMPYMALIRNLRNFGEAGISDEIAAKVAARVQDPEEVAKSMQFPFRFLNAFEHAPLAYAGALERATLLSTQNIPEGMADSLIVIDTSSSMRTLSENYARKKKEGRQGQNRPPIRIAAVVAMSLYHRSPNATLAIFGDSHALVRGLTKTTGILRGVEQIERLIGSVGHSSYGHSAINAYFDPSKHDRAFIFTDGQLHDSGSYNLAAKGVKRLYTWNIGGYPASHVEVGKNGSYELGGFTDATFRMVPLLERGRSAAWPF